MKKALFYFAFVVALFLGINTYAQDIVELSPYEQKREQLITQAMEKLMNTMSAYDKAQFSINLMNAIREAHEEGDRFQEMVISENILFLFCDIGEGLQTEANLLVNSFDLSDVYFGESLQEWKEIGKWYKQERIKIDQSKTADDIEREHIHAEFMGNSPGIQGVKQRVRREFLRWARKGEFEKTVAYNERLSQKGAEVFDSLCFVHFNAMVNSELHKKGGEYDADKEGYDVRFYYGEEGDELSFVDGFWSVQPDVLKTLSSKTDWDFTYSKGLFQKDGYLFPATYHWRLSGRGYWNEDQDFDIVLGEAEPVILSMEDVLNGTSLQVGKHTFDYSEYSIGLVSWEALADMVWDFFQGEDNDYLKTVSDVGRIQGERYRELFPEGRIFFTKEQVESVFNRLASEKAAKEKEKKNDTPRERISGFTDIFGNVW